VSARLWAVVLFAGAAIAACGGGSSPGGARAFIPDGSGAKRGTPIQHVIVVIQENRSFDNLFATFPGADGATTGRAAPMPSPIASSCAARHQPVIAQPTTVPLTKVSLTGKGFKKKFGWDNDLDHVYTGYKTELDGTAMDGFDLVHFGADGSGAQAECTYAYQYVDPKDIAPYWDLAKQYVLADHMFDTQGSSSFTGHQDLIAGATVVNYKPSQYGNNSIIDNPSGLKWGCEAPPGTTTSLINTSLQVFPGAGPAPCFSYATLRDLLDAKKLSWKYYAVAVNKGGGGIWSAFDAIDAVRNGPEWKTNVSTSPQQIFSDISKHRLPAVSWLTPDAPNSDHPFEIIKGVRTDNGPSWVASVVNAIGTSEYWNSSAIVILWDDSGGFYDHEPPAFFDDQGGLGFRVPMLIVSPYVRAHVESTQYEHASVVKFIEQNWNLGKLGTEEEKRATPITNAFNFNQTPRPFQTIPSSLHRDFFLRQKPSGLPVDTQ
jgi:phospholipase C